MAAVASTRFYYADDDQRFERSLDLYVPVKAVPTRGEPAPLVVMVVGSGWLGHSRLFYLMFSWWNSSGPRTVAALGCPCVCVRHRGGFLRPPPLATCVALFAFTCFLFLHPASAVVTLLYPPARSVAAVLLALALVWHALAHGAATHEDMIDDVGCALRWIQRNRQKLVAPGCAPPTRRLFGGYSSGGHVAVSLLQRPEKLREYGLAAPAAGYDGILLLSGVFGTRGGAPLPPSRWARFVTAAIARFVLGSKVAAALPSPVHSPQLTPKVPHFLLYCEREAFGFAPLELGLSLLLCSPQYASALTSHGVPVRLRAVQSDHWNVLNSKALSEALYEGLIEDGWPTALAAKGAREGRKSKSPARGRR
jgi:acetyl esterase/lipase